MNVWSILICIFFIWMFVSKEVYLFESDTERNLPCGVSILKCCNSQVWASLRLGAIQISCVGGRDQSACTLTCWFPGHLSAGSKITQKQDLDLGTPIWNLDIPISGLTHCATTATPNLSASMWTPLQPLLYLVVLHVHTYYLTGPWRHMLGLLLCDIIPWLWNFNSKKWCYFLNHLKWFLALSTFL